MYFKLVAKPEEHRRMAARGMMEGTSKNALSKGKNN